MVRVRGATAVAAAARAWHRWRCSRAATPRSSFARRLDGRSAAPFHYRDKGNLATIGRAAPWPTSRACSLSGLVAWVTWLMVHLFYLIGFQNRVLVFMRWS